MKRLIAGMLFLPAIAHAEEWVQLSGPEIAQALTSRVVIYEEGVAQDFLADGRTIKAGGRGLWQIDGAKVCVRWPPFEIWECSIVERKGIDLRLTTDRGDVMIVRYGDL